MMGVDSRRPLLPAPTESIVDTTGGSTTGTDLATDISRRTDKTSYSIPDDGSPVTIPIRRKHRARDKDDPKLSHSSHHSQTSLLIEYFEGGKDSGTLLSRPSVRVRVTPSSSKKSKDQRDHIQISEARGDRKPSYSRRISLSSPFKQKQLLESGVDDQSAGSSTSAVDDNHTSSRHPPVEIELMNRDQTSELSTLSRDARYMQPTSDISSMPPDSMLDASSAGPRRKRSQSLDRAEKNHGSDDLLKTPSRQRSRSLSKERIAHRVAEKLSNPQKEESSGRHRRSERSKRDGKDLGETDSRSSRRRHHGYRDEDFTSPESSLLSNSAVSSRRRSGDQYSIRSGTSKSSINNPKLLETVEDAIRRLILPELKELKKDQKVISNTSKFERDLSTSYSSASSPSRDGLGRRLSKHASAPDVMKPKVVLNKNSKDEGLVLAGEPTPPKKERKSSKDSQSSEPYVRWGHRPDLTEQDKLRRQRSKGLRDAEKAGIVGTTLTAAALKHHDSKTSLDNEGGRRGSEPKGINETELVFRKHNVPALPLHSEIDSELTRDSLLSQRTEETTTPRRESKVQEVSRGSPMQVASPTSHTPDRTPNDQRYGLANHHSNLSSHNLSQSPPDQDWREQSRSPAGDAADGVIAAAATANLLDPHSGHHDFGFSGRGRTLSPIQSVASDQSDAHIKHSPQQDENWPSEGERGMEPRLSIETLSSAPSTNLARSTRPDNNSVQSQTQSLKQPRSGPELGYEESPTQSRGGNWEELSDSGDAYRKSFGETSSIDGKRMTDYGDESEINYMEKVNQGQHVTDGFGANPQFVHPLAVESAVASLLEPSVLESSTLSGNRSAPNLSEQVGNRSPKSIERQEGYGSRQGSPLKQQQNVSSPDETSFPRRMGATSPPQSVTQSIEDQDELGHTIPADTRDIESSPLPEAAQGPESESEINTNPSIIQGPIGGVSHESRDHWPGAAALGAGGQPGYAQDYYQPGAETSYGDKGYFDQQDDTYMGGQLYATPPGAKDEGYMSGANPLSPSDTPQPGTKGIDGIDANGLGLFDSPTGDDPFTSSHQRNVSGYSHGAGSPLYDSATGRGIERIQSKDIVALMDHLTVRDAQRNARDTEILVTLVRSAAEMRTSFEEMKKFIAQQDGLLMEASDKQHERTYRALGPRPNPSGPRSRQSPGDDDDIRSKRQNVFKRALKGLSLKSSNDLSKVEEMLEQLLDEVEALRAAQDPRSRGLQSGADQNGYEMNGHAGIPFPGDMGYSNSRGYDSRNGQRDSEDRTNTMRGMDEVDFNERGEFLSPQLGSREYPNARHERAGSAPVETPTRVPVATGALSNEASPRSNEKARKHKSSSSSFFPKISRWSKTTASSMGDNIRNSMQPGRKDRPYLSASRSGSDLNIGQYSNTHNFYDPQGDDRIRSNFTLNEQQQENRPPSPLVPSQVSEAPKYRAHRGSLDLQHPQPRQGPSGRYQTQLESQAQDYGSPISPVSDGWVSNPSLSGVGANHKRVSGASRLSPISDAGYSETSSRFERQSSAPPRPPKIKDDGPLIPERPPKIKDDEGSYVERMTSRSSAMRTSPRNTPPVRKPTGPRPLTSGQYSPEKVKRTRYRGSPNQIDDEYDYY